MGVTLNEVMPSMANDSIFLSGYFDSPAKRSARSYSTVVERKPISGTMPRRKRLTSPKSARWSSTRRLVRRKSAWLSTMSTPMSTISL